MGEVWLAHDRELEIRMAVKLLHPRLAAAEGAVAFMKNECRAARNLAHPDIVRIFDFHQQGELAFISMEWIDGPTFDHWRQAATISPSQQLRALTKVAGALDYVHRQGLVHRDVKARNILIAPSGKPKLTDFGIVGLFRFQSGMLSIQSGGSQAGMSPQQREGRPPHPADDIYAFGVLLNEILSDRRPHPDRPMPTGATDTLAPDFSPLSPTEAAASRDLLSLTQQMLARARDERPASMAVVKMALEAALDTPDDHTPPQGATESSTTEIPTEIAAEGIAPQPYAFTAEKPVQSANRQRALFWIFVLAMGAAGLIAAGIVIIGFLADHPLTAVSPATLKTPPRSAPPEPETTAGRAAVSPAPTTAPAPETLDLVEKTMARWLHVQALLKTARAAAWAPEKLSRIQAAAQQADAAMMKRAYARAAEAYATAIAGAESLLAGKEAFFASLMQQGQQALQADQPAAARPHFTLALKIKPDDAGARRGIAAADLREQVLTLMASGQSHEREGRYDLALADYESALKRDKTDTPARRAVDRLKDQIAETQYNLMVSKGLSAFYQDRLSDARRHIQAALQYRPGGHEAREALRQIDAAAREQRIARLQRRGQKAETGEQWDQALKAYEDVLSIDPALQFARHGAERSRERIRLDKRIRFYLDHPEALSSERYLEEARQLLHSITALEPRGPRLAGHIQTLQAGIQAAQTRVLITLLSDGQTEVAVLRVARLGRITRQSLELRPGTYTIVGARNGYKDVRQTIRIEADQKALQVSIACKEKI